MSNLLITSTDILEFFKPDDPAHVKCLQEVRDLIPAESSRNASDSDLARFLIARKFNVEDAVKLFTAHVVWRAANPYVTKADCLPSLACQTTYHHGFDREVSNRGLTFSEDLTVDISVLSYCSYDRVTPFWCSKWPSTTPRPAILMTQTACFSSGCSMPLLLCHPTKPSSQC